MKKYEIYSFKVRSNPVFSNGYITGYDTIEYHTIIVESFDELDHLLDNETCSECKLIGHITARELKESAARILITA